MTLHALKVGWKDDGARVVLLDKSVRLIPYADLLSVQRTPNQEHIVVAYKHQGEWSYPNVLSKTRINPHIVRYDLARGAPVFVRESEDAEGPT